MEQIKSVSEFSTTIENQDSEYSSTKTFKKIQYEESDDEYDS